MRLDPNFRALLSELLERDVRFLIVGGYALAAHGYPRYTGDLDVWVDATPENADLVIEALDAFGFAGLGLTSADFVEPDQVVQLGRPPLRVDLLTSIDGVEFNDAFEAHVTITLDGLDVPFISRKHLVANKQASGRLRDLADLEHLGDGGD